MTIDINALASTVVASFLVPYAKFGLEFIAEGAGTKFGEKAADYVSNLTSKLWERIQSAFSSSEDQSLMRLFANNPTELSDMLVKALQQKLEKDPHLVEALSQLVDGCGPDEKSTGAQIMNASLAGILDMREADLSHAKDINLAGVMIGNNQIPDTDK